MRIPEILKKIAETSSTLDKVAIMKENKSDMLAKIFDYAYNRHITFGITSVDISNLCFANYPVDEEEWILDLSALLNCLQKREITGNTARNLIIALIIKYSNVEYGEVILNILQKDLRINCGAKLINKVYPNLIPEEFCMLASPYNEKKLKFPCYVDAKLDGLRGVAIVNDTEVKMYSRNGKELKNYKVIEEELKLLKTYFGNALTFDGEITGKNFQDIMRTVTRKEDGIEMASDAVYNIFDIVEDIPEILGTRINYLNMLQQGITSLQLEHIRVNVGKVVDTYEEALEYYNECLSNGYEGIMLKNLDGIYEYKRSTAWLKMKPTETADFEIVGMEEGTGKYVGKLGALICKLPNGETVKVGTGFKDAEREEYWNKKDDIIGLIAEIGFQEKTNDCSLRFPTFKCFRKDKS